MPRKKNQIIVRTIFFVLCAAILISAPLMIIFKNSKDDGKAKKLIALSVWQIDGFEGGKGSRAGYLQNIGNSFSKENGCYINVTSLSSSAALENIEAGNVPDLISYGAGMSGLESLIVGKTPYFIWAHGGYCFLTVNESADFTDISAENTVINGGIDNLSSAAGLLCGVSGAAVEKPTGAYVSLIAGKYKYLLGTQRDVFRLNTRGVSFKIKPVNEFNDLYQNISVTSKSAEKQHYAENFIKYLLSKSAELKKIGLMGATKLYDGELGELENLEYECKISSPVSRGAKTEILQAIANSDIKKLKSLLK